MQYGELELNNRNNTYDVAIIGGGVAGVSCAYNCSKLGLKTLLIEKECYLGGDVTGGLVIPVMKTDTKNLNTRFFNELIKYSKKANAQLTYADGNQGWFNPVTLPSILEKMLCDVKCEILFNTEIKNVNSHGKTVKNLEINFNTLSLPIVSKYYVDTTGNASLAKILKCKLWDDTNIKQPASLRFLISGVDLNLFANFLNEIDKDKNVTTTYRDDTNIHLSTAYTWDNTKKWALDKYFKTALKDNVLKEHDLSYFQLFSVAGMPNTVALNCPRLRDYDINDPFDYSVSLIEAREAILRLHNFLVKYIQGFKDSYISNIASRVGQRETVRVKCKYDYTINDIIEQKTFENPALHSNYPVDIHSNQKDKSVLYKVCSYTFPVESLMSDDYDNLFVAGKIAGCDFKSHAALRVQSSCMSMGEAVAYKIFKNIK